MEEERERQNQEVVISEEALKEAEKYIEEEEGPSRRLSGKMDVFITVVAVVMSLFHLYAASPFGVVMTQVLRGIHVLLVLFLSFLVHLRLLPMLRFGYRLNRLDDFCISGTTAQVP